MYILFYSISELETKRKEKKLSKTPFKASWNISKELSVVYKNNPFVKKAIKN